MKALVKMESLNVGSLMATLQANTMKGESQEAMGKLLEKMGGMDVGSGSKWCNGIEAVLKDEFDAVRAHEAPRGPGPWRLLRVVASVSSSAAISGTQTSTRCSAALCRRGTSRRRAPQDKRTKP